MDIDSPEKIMGTSREEDGSSPIGNPDSNLFGNKDDQRGNNFLHEDEAPCDGMQGYMDQEYHISPIPHVNIDSEDLHSPITKSNSADLSSPAKDHSESFLPVESDLNHDDMERRYFDYDTKEQGLSMEDYRSNEKKEEIEDAEPVAHPSDFLDSNIKKEEIEDAEPVAHPSDFLENNVSETYNNEFHHEESYPLAHNSLLTGDNNNSYEMMGDEAFNHQIPKSPALDEAEARDVENTSANFHIDKSEVHGEMDGGSSSPHPEVKEDEYSVIAASENGGMVWENSSQHSPQRTQNASPSPVRQFSISAERPLFQQSPHTSSSPREGVQSPTNIDKKSAPSRSPSRRKRSSSPEKHVGGRKRHSSRDRSSPAKRKSSPERTIQRDYSSRDRSSPTKRKSSPERTIQRDSSPRDRSSPTKRRSSPERATQKDSHHRDGSPRRHTAPSRRRESPRRRGRSASRSPVRRRVSPERRRGHQHRPRSRSPHAKDRSQRSPPRRRPSPRRRSPPPSYSRRRSPKRPWSPPANRNTGLGKPGNNLFVAGFSYLTTEKELEKKFSRFGRVMDVRIVRNRSSGESRGFGFITLERDEDADAAIRAVDQTEWHGRIVLVEKSKTSTR